MTTSPKRSFPFSLRWLIVVMVVLFVFVSRVIYFHQRASFHEQEAARYESMMSERSRLLLDDAAPLVQAHEHRYLAERYRRAMYRPLTVIFEPIPPWKQSKEVDDWCLHSRF
ncbi:MAG: hypothetical protein K8R36_17800 [Planctomycetales bacterium]|nr:hypothetical protein [Planctomycetales bacterium]